MIIKKMMSIFVFFIISSIVFAETDLETKSSTQYDSQSELKNNNNKIEQNSLQKQTNKQPQKKWPPTFYPSEKINADSSVSFPVDI